MLGNFKQKLFTLKFSVDSGFSLNVLASTGATGNKLEFCVGFKMLREKERQFFSI